MNINLEIAGISWIHAEPNPVTTAAQALYLKPHWIPKVCIGLVATANTPPKPIIKDFGQFILQQNFRSLTYINLFIDLDERKHELKSVKIAKSILNPGFTPPFNRWRFPSTFLKPDPAMSDRNTYPGELSSISKVTREQQHPNSVIARKEKELLIFNSLLKFRAGSHTDNIGISVGSPYHVPWVWSEMLLAYRTDGSFRLYCAGSQFPTHSWYINGELVATQTELADKSFPTDGLSILEKSMNLYTALSSGAPADQPQTNHIENRTGAVSRHPNTLPGNALPLELTFGTSIRLRKQDH